MMTLPLDETLFIEELTQTGQKQDTIYIFEALLAPRTTTRMPVPGRDYHGDRPNLNWPAFLTALTPSLPKYRRTA